MQAVGDRPVLIVDECRRTGGQAEALMALMAEQGVKRSARLTAADSFIATGPAYGATLPSREGIVAAARHLLRAAPPPGRAKSCQLASRWAGILAPASL